MSPGDAADGVAIVICSRNRPRFLADALAAAVAAARPQDEVVAVDSASDGPATAEVASAAGCRLVRLERPGLSVARNAGVAATGRAIVAFTDDDCLADRGWPAALAAAFADPSVGVVFGRLVAETPDGAAPSGDPGPEPVPFDRTADPALLGAGACMAFRRTALEQVGGFDELLGSGAPLRAGEDHDAVWRVLRAGWHGRYEPAARVTHREWRDTWQLVRMQWGYGVGAGAVAAKISRIEPTTGRVLLRRRLGRDGVVKVARNLAKGWERPALASALYTLGVVTGACRVRGRTLENDRFVA